MGMTVLVNDPPRARAEGSAGFVSLDELLERADVISLHVPLNKSGVDRTAGMVDDHFIEKVRPGTLLINTSRGGVLNEASVMKGISSGKLGEVVLDVFQNEPRVSRELLQAITLATPHIAGYSLDGKANGTGMAVRAVSRHFGLGLDNWQPSGIPAPDQPMLYADGSMQAGVELVWDLFRQSYDITRDDKMLRSDPGAFEELRGNYPPRREPGAFSVRVFQEPPGIREQLESLGFSVLSDHCA
jgi:erythronate-4-phosphate dehydrogenase